MNSDKQISISVIKRLPMYYRYLGELLEKEIFKISSKDLSIKMNITASQIRQDLNNFGCFGQQGYGYNVELLYNEIKKILGINKSYNLILIGSGNLGSALINYSGFNKKTFNFIAAFDTCNTVINQYIKDLKVSHISTLDKFFKSNKVDIAVLALPKDDAIEISKKVIKLGVNGIWNFSDADIKDFSGKVRIENVHLLDNLMTICYELKQY